MPFRLFPITPGGPGALLLLVLVIGVTESAGQPAGSRPTLSAVAVEVSDGVVRITLSGRGALVPDRPLEVSAPPPRLVLDFPGVEHTAPALTPVNASAVLRVRTARYSASPLVTRVVFDLGRRLPYQIDTSAQGQGRIVVVIGTGNVAAPSVSTRPSGDAAVAPPPDVSAAAATSPTRAPAGTAETSPGSSPASTPPATVPPPTSSGPDALPPAPAPPVAVAEPPPAAEVPGSPASSLSAGRGGEPLVGPRDVLSISLWDWPAFSGNYEVGTDGSFAFPMVGRVPAAGLTARSIEADLKRRLSDAYIKDPRLSLSVEPSRRPRIFIVGEVRRPGSLALASGMTLTEALGFADPLTPDAGMRATIVRTGGEPRLVPGRVPGRVDPAEVLEVDLTPFIRGLPAENPALRDGDVIFVSRLAHARVFVFGEVRAPGVYAVEPGTSVRQALEAAGGARRGGTAGRLTIVRWMYGTRLELRAVPEDILQPGDTIVVSKP